MNQLFELGQCLFVLAGATVVALGIWRAWTRPPQEETTEPAPEVQPAAWSLWAELGRLFLVENVRDYVTIPEAAGSADGGQRLPDGQTNQTDRQTDQESVADQWLDRLELDRTQTTVIELLVYSGWKVGEIRSILKGDSGALGKAIEEAKQRLQITDEPRMLVVRDGAEERLIPM